MWMIDNLDGAIILALDYDEQGNKYMTMNNVKYRDKVSREYIAQPFVLGSNIRLVTDVGMIPQFKESIHQAPELKRNSIIKISGASIMSNSIDDVIDINRFFFWFMVSQIIKIHRRPPLI